MANSIKYKNQCLNRLQSIVSLNSLFEKVHLDISEKLNLFDSMIMPILMYGAEAWGFHGAPDAERVNTKFLKRMLSVRPQTTNAAVYGELGRDFIFLEKRDY